MAVSDIFLTGTRLPAIHRKTASITHLPSPRGPLGTKLQTPMTPFAYVLPVVIWVATLLVCVLCVYAAWRSLFADRGEGKRRCPKCWYDLAYSPGMTCGECGHIAQKESDFTHTRRRPGVALAAILICVVLVIGVNDQMNQRGMMRHLPTGMLIWALPLAGGMDGPVGREIDRRATQRQLDMDQWRALMERCAAGDWFNAPPSDGWVENYGGFIVSWRNRFIGDDALEAPLLAIPPRFQLRARESWPQDAPIVAAVRLDDWWPAGMECRVRAVPRIVNRQSADTQHEIAPLTFYRGGEMRFQSSPFAMYLPPLPPGEHEIVIDFSIDRRRMEGLIAPPRNLNDEGDDDSLASDEDDADDGWEPVGTFAARFTTRIEGAVADMIEPVSDPAMLASVAQVFGDAVRWHGGGRSPVRFRINAPMTYFSAFNDTAIGVSVELVRQGEVARRLNLWWIAGDNVADGDRNYGFEINHENLELLRQLEAGTIDADGWQLRIRSDPALALRAGSARRYWEGEITTTVNLRTSRSQAPPRMWWTENNAVEEADADAAQSRRGGRRSL